MSTYQFLVEGVFVALEKEGGRYGFFSTFTVSGGSLKSAANRVPGMLAERLHAHGVRASNSGILKTRCRMVELWELTDFKPDSEHTGGGGFTFFSIGHFALALALLKF